MKLEKYHIFERQDGFCVLSFLFYHFISFFLLRFLIKSHIHARAFSMLKSLEPSFLFRNVSTLVVERPIAHSGYCNRNINKRYSLQCRVDGKQALQTKTTEISSSNSDQNIKMMQSFPTTPLLTQTRPRARMRHSS